MHHAQLISSQKLENVSRQWYGRVGNMLQPHKITEQKRYFSSTDMSVAFIINNMNYWTEHVS